MREKYDQKKPAEIRENRQSFTFHEPVHPKETSQQCTASAYILRECTVRRSSWGSSIVVSDH